MLIVLDKRFAKGILHRRIMRYLKSRFVMTPPKQRSVLFQEYGSLRVASEL
jgi:hypothetical protein